MTGITWTLMEPSDDRPIHGPECPGPQSHRWNLIVEDEGISIGSGCPDCDGWMEDYLVTADLMGTLTFEHEHGDRGCPNAIRFLPCDCNSWWRFTPTPEAP